MNVAAMTMPPEDAVAKLRAARRSLHRRADAEYEALAKGYEALAKGLPLVNLAEAIRGAPLDEKGRPRLAVFRADQRQVKVSASRDAFRFSPAVWRSSRTERALEMGFPYPGAIGSRWKGDHYEVVNHDGYALVPIVPPEIKGPHDLKKCHILWEVEAWADSMIRTVADRDPWLLRHLGGDLYAVLGEWDLTDLERAVMAGRRS